MHVRKTVAIRYRTPLNSRSAKLRLFQAGEISAAFSGFQRRPLDAFPFGILLLSALPRLCHDFRPRISYGLSELAGSLLISDLARTTLVGAV